MASDLSELGYQNITFKKCNSLVVGGGGEALKHQIPVCLTYDLGRLQVEENTKQCLILPVLGEASIKKTMLLIFIEYKRTFYGQQTLGQR